MCLMKQLTISLLIVISALLSSCETREVIRERAPLVEMPTILALGDSVTAGYGLIESDSYPSQLQTLLWQRWYSYRVQNAWVSGDMTAGLLARMDWLLEWDIPALAILCIGANDAFQWKETRDIETNIRSIIEKLKAKKIPILLAGMRAPLNLGGEYGKQYEAIFPRLAKEYDLPFMPFLLEWVALQSSLNQDDRIHPNRAWYTIVAENLMRILEKEKLIAK